MIRRVGHIGLAGLMFLAAGCGTVGPMGRLPAPSEVARKSRYELQSQYPDLAKFDRSKARVMALGSERGDGRDLEAAWGEPDGWMPSAWNVIPFIAVLRPPTYWSWEMGDKKIEARIDHRWYRGYRPEVRWIDMAVANPESQPPGPQ